MQNLVPADLPGQQSIEDQTSSSALPETFVPRSWLEGGMAVVNRSGGVLEINEPFSHWLEKPASDLVGESLWAMLCRISPEWVRPVGEISHSITAFKRSELKLSGQADQPAQWFSLEAARGPDCIFVRLNSSPPPLTDLQEGGWNEQFLNDSARRDLFVRLLRAENRLEGLTRRWPCVIFSQLPDFRGSGRLRRN